MAVGAANGTAVGTANGTAVGTANISNVVDKSQHAHTIVNISIQPFGNFPRIGSDMLQEAACALSAGELQSCLEADTESLARLMTSLVKTVHGADPSTRNIRINPARQDQALVYDPERGGQDGQESQDAPGDQSEKWRPLELLEAIRSLFDKIGARLEVATPASATLAGAAHAAAKKQRDSPAEMPAASQKALGAHLAAKWPHEAAKPRVWPNTDRSPEVVGIRILDLPFENVLCSLALGVEAAVTENAGVGIEELAARALGDLGRRAMWRADAATVSAFSLTDAGLAAYVSPRGWRVSSAARVAGVLYRACVDALTQFLVNIEKVNQERDLRLAPETVRRLQKVFRRLVLGSPLAGAGEMLLRLASRQAGLRYGGREWYEEVMAVRECAEDAADLAWFAFEDEEFDRSRMLALPRARRISGGA